jgi:hypothetical protein
VLATSERSRKRKAQEMSDATDGDEEEQTAATFHAQPMPNFTKITVSIPLMRKRGGGVVLKHLVGTCTCSRIFKLSVHILY